MQHELFRRHNVPGVRPAGGLLQSDLHLERYIAVIGLQKVCRHRKRHRALAPRRRVRKRHAAFGHRLSVVQDGVAKSHLVEVVSRIAILQHEGSGSRLAELDILINSLHLQEFRGDAAVGRDDAVAAEVIVVGHVAEGAAEVEFAVTCPRHHDGLVHPVPDAAANHALTVVLDIVPILRQIADGVAHRMGIFAKDEGLVGTVTVHLLHLLKGRIHPGVHVRHLILAFVMHGTAVQGFDGIPFRHDVGARPGLVAQGPEDDGGVQAVAAHHPDGPVHIGRLPGRHPADGVVPMALLVRLVHDVQAIVVIQGIHLGIVGIMAGTHRIQVVPLHEEDILHHRFHRDGLAVDRMDVVPVRPFEVGQYVIDIELVLPEFHFAETVLEESGFKGPSGFVQHLHPDRVQIRLLRRPQFRANHRNLRSLSHFPVVLVV